MSVLPQRHLTRARESLFADWHAVFAAKTSTAAAVWQAVSGIETPASIGFVVMPRELQVVGSAKILHVAPPCLPAPVSAPFHVSLLKTARSD